MRQPDPDRDLPDPGVDDDGACVNCGQPVDDPRMIDCDRCHYRFHEEPYWPDDA